MLDGYTVLVSILMICFGLVGLLIHRHFVLILCSFCNIFLATCLWRLFFKHTDTDRIFIYFGIFFMFHALFFIISVVATYRVQGTVFIDEVRNLRG